MTNNTNTVDQYIQSLPRWQQENLSLFRGLLHKVVPDLEEAIKWGVPVFMVNKKMLFAMSAFKAHTKYNFIQNGALLEDTDKLFNNGFESKKSRGIDLREGDVVDEARLARLVDSAVQCADD